MSVMMLSQSRYKQTPQAGISFPASHARQSRGAARRAMMTQLHFFSIVTVHERKGGSCGAQLQLLLTARRSKTFRMSAKGSTACWTFLVNKENLVIERQMSMEF